MFMRLYDFDRNWDWMDAMSRQMGLLAGAGLRANDGWPEATLEDLGDRLVLTADLPGLTEQNLQLSIHDDVLTLAGERMPTAPSGYQAERQERERIKFSRSFALPTRVDPERTTAELKYGVLTVTLPMHEAAKPRAITVRAS